MNPSNSILGDVKNFLNIDKDATDFDGEILPHVSAAVSKLKQNGVCISTFIDSVTPWTAIANPGQENNPDYFNSIPLYIMLSTKILFDPPAPSTLEYYKGNLDETLWRLKVEYETSEV